MKAYTDIEQSKILMKILPPETADMAWCNNSIRSINYTDEYETFNKAFRGWNKYWELIPCWSLSALLNVIPYTIYKSDNEFYRLGIDKGYDDYAVWYNNNGFTITDLDVTSDNFVDACVAMIEKLHEQKLL